MSLALLLAACGSEARPNILAWEMDWDEMVAVIPEQDALGSPPDQNICQTTLASVREHSLGLVPSPSVTIDDLTNEWIAIAEAAFFGCPPDGQDITSFDDAYTEMNRIEESIATALES
jgi:hypothetical protein